MGSLRFLKENIGKIIELIVFLGLLIAVVVLSVMVSQKPDSSNIIPPVNPKIAINESVFGYTKDGQKVMKYVLKNKQDFEVVLLSYGATLQAIKTKDINSKLVNVVLGFDTIEEYADQTLNPYFGGIIGRVSNRISNGEFKLDGKTYYLDKNDGNNTLHGGKSGLNWKNWNSNIIEDGIKFTLESKSGDGGFPGNLAIEVHYRLSNSMNSLAIEYYASTSEPTPLDLTNHAYFNLEGSDSNKKIYDHSIKLFSDYNLDINFETVLVTGKINSVDKTKYDFRNYTRLGERIKAEGKWPSEGFDNYFISNQQSGSRIIASIQNPNNGIQLNIWSNQNGAQFYTSNFLNLTKSNGNKWGIHEAFCIETSNYPNAVNQPLFPSSILRPEGKYNHRTIFSFDTFKAQ